MPTICDTHVERQRGHWRALSPLAAPVAAPMEWMEPVQLT